MLNPLVPAVAVCAVAAAFEGLCAGKHVKEFFATLTFPRYSAPLWLWTVIGGLYYLLFGFLLYRLFERTDRDGSWSFTVALIVAMMFLNGASNYVIFRQKDLRRGFIIGALFPILDIALFMAMWRIDASATIWIIPYLVYRAYAVWWGYGLMIHNPDAKTG